MHGVVGCALGVLLLMALFCKLFLSAFYKGHFSSNIALSCNSRFRLLLHSTLSDNWCLYRLLMVSSVLSGITSLVIVSIAHMLTRNIIVVMLNLGLSRSYLLLLLMENGLRDFALSSSNSALSLLRLSILLNLHGGCMS